MDDITQMVDKNLPAPVIEPARSLDVGLPVKLRAAVSLTVGDDSLSLHDRETCRRFVVPLVEREVVEALIRGTTEAEVSTLLRASAIPATAEEYLAIHRSLRLLVDATPDDLVGELRAEIEERQLERLRALLAHARRTIPYYGESLSGLDEDALRTRADFARQVPLLTRARYRASFPDRWLPAGRSYLALASDPTFRIKQSSGTTAERLQVVQEVDYLMAIFASSFLHENIFDARHAIFGPLRCMDLDCFVELPSFEERYLGHVLSMASPDVMGQTPSQAAGLLGELARTGITRIVANPYYLAFTTWAARSAGPPPVIRELYLGYDYAQATTRAYLERIYDCRAHDIYGMAEGGYQMMRTCPRGTIHLNEEFFAFELVEQPELGAHRLVFTTLGNWFSPMIRYETSDLFHVDPARDRCACGSPLRIVEHFDGRLADVVELGARRATLGAVDRAIGAVDGLVMYRLFVESDDRVVIHALGDADPSEVRARVAGAIDRVFGRRVDVVVRSADTFELGRSGKFFTVEHARGRT